MTRMGGYKNNRGTSGGSRREMWLLGLMALAIGAMTLTPVVARAQDPQSPQRAVRLSDVYGSVSLSQDGKLITSQAMMNTPLFQGTQLTTADDGRAEIQFEDGSVARIAPDSAMTIEKLDGQGAKGNAEIVLNRGLGYFELQNSGQAGQISVHFADSVITTSGFTIVRVDMDNPPGQLAVFSGNAHIDRGIALSLDVHGGESVTLNADDPTRYDLAESIESNSWDAWNSDRDQALAAEASQQNNSAVADNGNNGYVNSDNPAWNDLNANGNWYDVPGQGYVWSPYDASNPGWDPYGYGAWTPSPGFGYIWASGYPWGYLPYAFGAWNYYPSFGWGWAPGMGGYNPWWGMGGGYYGPNIGSSYGGYTPPTRPPLRSHWPVGKRPYPVVVVNRHAPPGGSRMLPSRTGTAPVRIAGHSVAPLHPTLPRTAFNNHGAASGYMSRSGALSAGINHSTGVVVMGPRSSQPRYVVNRSGYSAGRATLGRGRTAGRPSFGAGRAYAPSSGRTFSGFPQGSRGYSVPSRSYSGGYHGSSGGGFHGGGGGGGGFHGGGGGGGGGFHGGGGGGGGHR